MSPIARDDDDEVVAGRALARDPPRDPLDAVGVGDGRAAVLLDDEGGRHRGAFYRPCSGRPSGRRRSRARVRSADRPCVRPSESDRDRPAAESASAVTCTSDAQCSTTCSSGLPRRSRPRPRASVGEALERCLGRAATTSWRVVARFVGFRCASSAGESDAGGLEQIAVVRPDAGHPHEVDLVDPGRG